MSEEKDEINDPNICCYNCRDYLPARRNEPIGTCEKKDTGMAGTTIDYSCFTPICERCKYYDSPEGLVNCSYYDECTAFCQR